MRFIVCGEEAEIDFKRVREGVFFVVSANKLVCWIEKDHHYSL
jgi:hypothetical protein